MQEVHTFRLLGAFQTACEDFSSSRAKNPPRLSAIANAALLTEFEKAAPAELAEVSALLNLTVNELEKIGPRVEPDGDAVVIGEK